MEMVLEQQQNKEERVRVLSINSKNGEEKGKSGEMNIVVRDSHKRKGYKHYKVCVRKATTFADMKPSNLSKRAGGIKIKSSKVLGSNAEHTSKPLSASIEVIHPKKRKATQHNAQYNKQELDASLVIIRKVMKIDATEPLNVPVNPEALGIPNWCVNMIAHLFHVEIGEDGNIVGAKTVGRTCIQEEVVEQV